MSELKKLQKARERLAAQREWAAAGAKYYENVKAMAKAGIRDIDLAIERIHAESKRAAPPKKSVNGSAPAEKPAKTKRRQNGRLPATSEAFWLGFLGKERRGAADLLNDALAELKAQQQFVPTREEKAALNNRLTVTLAGAIRKDVVGAAGPRGERRYWLKRSQRR